MSPQGPISSFLELLIMSHTLPQQMDMLWNCRWSALKVPYCKKWDSRVFYIIKQVQVLYKYCLTIKMLNMRRNTHSPYSEIVRLKQADFCPFVMSQIYNI